MCLWCMIDQPTWHGGGRERPCAGGAGAGRRPSWGGRGSTDAWQVGRGVRREGRLSRVALLALAARHTWSAHARTQSTFCARRQVVNGPWEILETQTRGVSQQRQLNKHCFAGKTSVSEWFVVQLCDKEAICAQVFYLQTQFHLALDSISLCNSFISLDTSGHAC